MGVVFIYLPKSHARIYGRVKSLPFDNPSPSPVDTSKSTGKQSTTAIQRFPYTFQNDYRKPLTTYIIIFMFYFWHWESISLLNAPSENSSVT